MAPVSGSLNVASCALSQLGYVNVTIICRCWKNLS